MRGRRRNPIKSPQLRHLLGNTASPAESKVELSMRRTGCLYATHQRNSWSYRDLLCTTLGASAINRCWLVSNPLL